MKITFRRSRGIRRRILPFVMSLVMVLTINMTAYAADAPTITTHPASQTAEEGQPAGFRVWAVGTKPLSYQWQKDGIDISGGTSAALDIPNVRGADSGSYTVVVTDAAGNSVTSGAATLTVIRTTVFQGVKYPCGIAVDGSGNIFIADTGNNAVKKMDADGSNIVTLGSGFNYPCGVAVDGNGYIYVADTNNDAVKRMDADGSNIVTLDSGFNCPCGVAVDSSGNIYVADTYNNAVKRMNADGSNIVTLGSDFINPSGVAVDSSGNIYAVVVYGGYSAVQKMNADGNIIASFYLELYHPNGIAVDGSGNIYVADTENNVVKRMDADGKNIMTLGSGFRFPSGVAVDGSGNIYVADSRNNAVKKMDADGKNIVTLDAGFDSPRGVAADGSGNIYIADYNSNTVKKMDADGKNIVFLGSGFYLPRGVVADSSGNVYVTDFTGKYVKKMDADGNNILTLGSGFGYPSGIAMDGSGNIYVADYVADYDSSFIKKMDADGNNIVTLGSGFDCPYGVAVDDSGNIYVADTYNCAVKRMNADGSNIVILSSDFYFPCGVAVDGSGSIYVADTDNNAVKRMDADGSNIVTLGSGFNYPCGVAVDGNGYIYVADTDNNAIKRIQLLYGVAYNSNGSTGGSVPTDGNSYEQGDAITVAGNTGNLVRTGYIFAGWNTAADGSGTSYAAGATVTMPAGNLTLYAIWEDIPVVTGAPGMVLGTSGIEGGGANWIYYGENSSSPVKWRVLDVNNDYDSTTGGTQSALFLLSEFLLTERSVSFDSTSPYSNAWQGSTAQGWCGNFYSNNFDPVEQSAIAATVKTDSSTSTGFAASVDILSNDMVFFLSAEETETSSYGFSSYSDRTAKVESSAGSVGGWWLRSPYATDSEYAGVVTGDGFVDRSHVAPTWYARPAFNLNLSSVLFSSAAEGGKSSDPIGADALNAVSATAPTEWKLTLEDSGRSFSVAEHTASTAGGGSVTLHYSGATVYDSASAPNEYISAIIVDASDNILYYGRLAQPTIANGYVDLDIPSDLAEGSYTLKAFSEQCNGDYETDYASAFSDISLTVDNTAPMVSSVTPTGTGAAPGGNLTITFSEELDTDVIGTVTLGGVTYTNGDNAAITVSGNTVTVDPVDDFVPGTEYTGLVVSGFKDTTGNLMAAYTDPSYHFVTEALTLSTPIGLAWDVFPGKAKWGAVDHASGYNVQLYKGGTAQGSVITGVTVAYYDFTPVIASAGSGNYTFKVTAIGDGTNYTNSDQSAESDAYSYTAPTTPTAPQNFSATPGDGQVSLSWAAPASDGGVAITKYEVSKDGGSTWIDVTSGTSYTFTGLTNGQSYTFEVQAVNDVGTGTVATVTATPQAAAPTDKTLVSITTPAAITGVTNGTAKTASALGLPSTVTLVTNGGSVQANVTWDVYGCSYGPYDSAEQTFTVDGTVTLPSGVINPDSVSLTTSITVTVNAATATDKILVNVAAPSAITGVANGTAKTASALGLPSTVTLVTNGGSVQANVTWDVYGCSYGPYDSAEQTFTVDGTVTLPSGVINPDNIPLTISISVSVKKASSSGGGGGGGGGGGSGSSGSSRTSNTPVTPTYKATVSGINISETTLFVNVNTNAGSATTDLGNLVKDIFAGSGTAVLTIPAIPGVNSYTLGIPVASLSGSQGEGALTFSTGVGSVTIPADMLAGTEGKKAGITIAQGDKTGLPEEVKTAIGDRPIVQLILSLDGTQTEWNNPDAPVTVSIPYTPTAAELENPESIVIWYIDGSGKAVSVPNGRYDAATGTVTFTTTHFSHYAVSCKQVSFEDVAKDAWYTRAVSFIAAREITTGTSNGNFSPEAKLTRGEFIVLMVRAYDISPDTNPTDNFSDAGNTYYTGYLAAAKRLGISSGIGNNQYAPDKEITRQEMFTMLYNALKVIGQLPGGDSGKTLSDFTDTGRIDAWAKEAMTLLVKIGTVDGSNEKLTPQGTTTRAEMAQVLYNLLGK